MAFIAADPYPWPFDGDLAPREHDLIVIDMQTDFAARAATSTCSGYDISPEQPGLHRADFGACSALFRKTASTSSIPARVTAPTSPICPANKRWRSRRHRAAVRPDRHRRRRPCGRVLGPRRTGLGHHPGALTR